MVPFIFCIVKPIGVHPIFEEKRMTEKDGPVSEAVGLPPATLKTKEQWLEESNGLRFFKPVRYEEALTAYEQAIRLDPNDGLTTR
jgi:hypothetical protein